MKDPVRCGFPGRFRGSKQAKVDKFFYRCEDCLSAQAALFGDGPDAWVGPAGAKVGIEADDEIDLDGRTVQLLERFRLDQVVFHTKEIGIHEPNPSYVPRTPLIR